MPITIPSRYSMYFFYPTTWNILVFLLHFPKNLFSDHIRLPYQEIAITRKLLSNVDVILT